MPFTQQVIAPDASPVDVIAPEKLVVVRVITFCPTTHIALVDTMLAEGPTKFTVAFPAAAPVVPAICSLK